MGPLWMQKVRFSVFKDAFTKEKPLVSEEGRNWRLGISGKCLSLVACNESLSPLENSL